MIPEQIAQFETALASDSPMDAVLDYAKSLKSQGMSQDEMYHLFEEFFCHLRAAERYDDEDPIVDTIEFIAGWCSRRMMLYPDQEPMAHR